MIKEYNWDNVNILKHHGPLILGQTSIFIRDTVFREDNAKKLYEIIYRLSNNEAYILWQNINEEKALTRFGCLESLVTAVFSPSGLYRAKCLKFLQNLVDTMNQHPSWLDVHIAAYHGLVEFFKSKNFTNEEINIQKPPDYYTPLHLAVKQQLRSTVERIIQFHPNFVLVDHEKNSVLHLAATVNIKIFKLLLFNQNDYKIFLRAENNQGLNPIELICLNSRKEHLIHLMKIGLTPRMLSITNDKHFLSKIDDKNIVPFADSDLISIDFNRINSGGCPLHWSNKPKGIKKFLPYFDKETPNSKGETPLMVMVKNDHFHCALFLLFHGVDVNKTDSNNDSPLHIAVQRANILLIKALIIFDSDVNLINSKHLNPYELARSIQQSSIVFKEVIEIFDSFYKTRKNTDQVPEGNSFFGNKTNCFSRFEMQQNNKKENSILKQDESIRKSRLICLDGGGVKGLFTVQMMIELEKYLKKKELINYFDWIAGTSTGSMIAFALINKKTLVELRKLYFTFKDEILRGNRPYNSENLEDLFKGPLGGNILLRDVWNSYRKHLIITASRVDCYPPTLQLLCSHDCPSEMFVWQALRASCAAPTYFHHYPPYIDGGLISNNPTLDSMTEFFRYNQKNNQKKRKSNQMNNKLELVLSFGTGHTKSLPKNFSNVFNKFNYFMDFRSFVRDLAYRTPWTFGNELASQMKTQVTNCNEHIVHRSSSWCSCLDIYFFRINAIFSKKIPLDESKDEELITGLWDVKLYCSQMSDYFKRIAKLLDRN